MVLTFWLWAKWDSRFRPLTGMVSTATLFLLLLLSFRPLAGIVRLLPLQRMGVDCFRPLTGMVLYDYQIKGFFKEFSPPYGDGTMKKMSVFDLYMFSPPYGDCTGLRVDGNNGWFVFAPLRGWYSQSTHCLFGHTCFRPLAGMVPKPRTKPRESTCFRPLTGMVSRAALRKSRSKEFRPLTGMVPTPKTEHRKEEFSPPYGDGTR